MCIIHVYTSFSFHNKLKTNPRYLNHCVNCRCDDLMEVLLKIEEDMFHERKRKEIMLTPVQATLKVDGAERHKSGKCIPDSSVQMHV